MSKKSIINAGIIENKKIEDNVFKLIIQLPQNYPDSVPGQFVNVYLNDASKLLPRPISIFDHDNNIIELAYMITGVGTQQLSEYKVDSLLRISTPLGNGFKLPDPHIDKPYTFVIVGGGIGIAPLHYAAKYIKNNYQNTEILGILGYRDQPFFEKSLVPYCDNMKICSENSHSEYIQGNVLVPLKDMDSHPEFIYLACGPTPMLHAVSHYAEELNLANLQVSVEERMGCGFGTCVGCSIRIKKPDIHNSEDSVIIQSKVCKDGPVFNGNEVMWNE